MYVVLPIILFLIYLWRVPNLGGHNSTWTASPHVQDEGLVGKAVLNQLSVILIDLWVITPARQPLNHSDPVH